MKINFLPVNIYIDRNEKFFAKIEWFLYKYFNIKRTIPCGQTKENKYLYCAQPIDYEHCYYSKEDKTEIRCKCCDKVKIMSNRPIDLKSMREEDLEF